METKCQPVIQIWIGTEQKIASSPVKKHIREANIWEKCSA